jgi:HJR/Mrr/RecB family endonuclease
MSRGASPTLSTMMLAAGTQNRAAAKARDRRMYLIELRAAVEFLVYLGVVGVLVHYIDRLPSLLGGDVGRVVLVFGVVAGACRTVYLLERAGARRNLFKKASGTIERQKKALVRRRAQLVRHDAYGKPLLDKWTDEIDYFITHHIAPALTTRERDMLSSARTAIADLVASRVEAELRAEPAFRGFSDAMSPADFEVFCAEELRRTGWTASVTGQSRDQGADVIAEKAGTRVVLQCKLYSRQVGNKSVQEAAAARAHELADHAIVVTNNGYTPAAEALAATNRIFLLHYKDLSNLEGILRLRR